MSSLTLGVGRWGNRPGNRTATLAARGLGSRTIGSVFHRPWVDAHPRRALRTAAISLAVVATVCAAVPTAAIAAESGASEQVRVAAVRSTSAAITSRIDALRTELRAEPAEASAARALLADSAGKVLNDQLRMQLAAAVAAADAAATRVSAALGRKNQLELPSASAAASAVGDLTTLRHRLAALPTTVGTAAIATDAAAVRSDMAAWTAEQQREAAAQAAAAAAQAAAAQAAAQQAAAATHVNVQHSNAPQRSSAVPAAAAPAAAVAVSSGYTLPIAGTASMANLQGMINSCRGAVNGSGIYGVSNFYMVRWSCGGSGIPRAAGATVIIAGVRYISHGVVGQGVGGGSAASIPRGYDAVIQTSGNGSERSLWFFGLTRA